MCDYVLKTIKYKNNFNYTLKHYIKTEKLKKICLKIFIYLLQVYGFPL